MTYIRHLAASQRLHYRVNTPLHITLNGEEYLTSDWSISGFSIADFPDDKKKGETLGIHVNIPFQGFVVGFPAQASVVRYHSQEKTLGAQFKNLDMRSKKILETFIHGIVSGEMQSIDGVIRRIDVPVTPISLAHDKNQTLPAKENAWKRQRGLRFYAAAGVLLGILLVTMIYTNFFQLKIDSAVVMGTNDVINAPTAGTLTYTVPLNKDVPAGTPLVSISDPRLDYDITMADLKVRNATIEARRLEALLQAERQRLASAHGIVSKQWDASANMVNTLQRDLEVKEATIKKTRDLMAQGLETSMALQKAQSDYMETERQLDAARLSEVTLEQQLAAVKGGFQVRDQYVQTGMQDVQALANAATQRLDIARSELDFLNKRKADLTITAPAEGRLVRVFTPLHGTAKLGDPIAVFERTGKRMIQVFLTQQEALNIIKGQVAKAYTPYSWWSFPVRVVDIDYYSLTLNQTQGRFQWQNLLNAAFKTVVVMVEPVGRKYEKRVNQIAPGTAATVVF